MRISINWERNDRILVAALVGRVDSSNANEFQKMMEAAIVSKDKALIMDFEQVSFISSAGLRVVVIMAKKFKGPYKKFSVCALPEPISKLFSMSGLDQTLSVYGSRAEAMAAVSQEDVEEQQRKAKETIEVREAIDFIIVGDNIEDITDFTVEKYEFTNDVTLSAEMRAEAAARIKDVLWQEVERLKRQRKLLLEKMFRDAKNTLDKVIAEKK